MNIEQKLNKEISTIFKAKIPFYWKKDLINKPFFRNLQLLCGRTYSIYKTYLKIENSQVGENLLCGITCLSHMAE